MVRRAIVVPILRGIGRIFHQILTCISSPKRRMRRLYFPMEGAVTGSGVEERVVNRRVGRVIHGRYIGHQPIAPQQSGTRSRTMRRPFILRYCSLSTEHINMGMSISIAHPNTARMPQTPKVSRRPLLTSCNNDKQNWENKYDSLSCWPNDF